MKRVFLLCVVGMASLNTHATTIDPPQPVQPFNAVIWTTKTLHSPSGKPFIFMQRTIYTRDAFGNVRREIYQPTKGSQHDTTAPLERVLTSSSSAEGLPTAQSSKEILEQDVDLGTSQFFGVLATGRRQTFQDAKGQHTLETWFSADLGLNMHLQSRNANGDSLVSDLSELYFDNPASPSMESVQTARPAIPLLTLYRGLFAEIAHMERDGHATDSIHHVNMNEIEDHLREQMSLSASQWQVLVEISVQVENYTLDMSRQARAFANSDRAARQKNNLLSTDTKAAGRATLHALQLDLNTHVQGEIDKLRAAIGLDAINHVQAYLEGPLAASTTVIPSMSAQLRTHKEQAR